MLKVVVDKVAAAVVVPIEYNKNSGVYTMKLSWVFFFQVHVLVFFHGYRTQDNESPHVSYKLDSDDIPDDEVIRSLSR